MSKAKKKNRQRVENNSIKSERIENNSIKKERIENNRIENENIEKPTFRKKTVAFAKLLWECMTYKMALFVVVAIYVIYVFSGFKTNIRHQINQNTKSYLKSMVQESLEKIEMKIHDEFIVLDTMELFCNDDIEMEITSEMLEQAMETHSFEGISLFDSARNSIVTIGNVGDYADDGVIDSALSGNDAVSAIYVGSGGKEFISLAVPVYGADGKINGALMCNYDIREFTQIIDTSSFEKLGTTLISEEDGLLVSRPESVGSHDNLFDLLDSININNEKSIKKLKKSITNGQSGIITYGSGKHKRYICYNVIPDTNWYAVSIVSANAIEPVVRNISKIAVNFTIYISLVAVGFIILTLAIDMKLLVKRKSMQEN